MHSLLLQVLSFLLKLKNISLSLSLSPLFNSHFLGLSSFCPSCLFCVPFTLAVTHFLFLDQLSSIILPSCSFLLPFPSPSCIIVFWLIALMHLFTQYSSYSTQPVSVFFLAYFLILTLVLLYKLAFSISHVFLVCLLPLSFFYSLLSPPLSSSFPLYLSPSRFKFHLFTIFILFTLVICILLGIILYLCLSRYSFISFFFWHLQPLFGLFLISRGFTFFSFILALSRMFLNS